MSLAHGRVRAYLFTLDTRFPFRQRLKMEQVAAVIYPLIELFGSSAVKYKPNSAMTVFAPMQAAHGRIPN